MTRVAIYARVSTADKEQDTETQLMPLREYAQRRGFEVAHELIDEASGRSAKKRPSFQKLMELARQRKIDVVLVFRYSRFARSVKALVNALDEFDCLGVDFISLKDGTDTTTAQGKFLFTVMAGLTEMESDIISENVKAGMARAKAQGKRLGRSSKTAVLQETFDTKFSDNPPSARKLAVAAGVSVGAAHAFIKSRKR